MRFGKGISCVKHGAHQQPDGACSAVGVFQQGCLIGDADRTRIVHYRVDQADRRRRAHTNAVLQYQETSSFRMMPVTREDRLADGAQRSVGGG